MARRATPTTPPPLEQTAESLAQGIARLNKVLEAIEAFSLESIGPDEDSALTALRVQIDRAIERTFGEGTSDYQRYARASSIHGYRAIVFGEQTSIREYRQNVQQDLITSKALISEAINGLKGDLEEITGGLSAPSPAESRAFRNRAFIVHGRADGPKEMVARFLESLGIQPTILHEQPSQGRSVIEKIEAYDDVDFAIVLLTPDDIGGLAGAEQAARPRQNVMFELGYFIGKLGRSKVCAMRQGEMEMATDYVGPIWVDLDAAGAWKQLLAQELDAAGFEIDFNRVMRRSR